MIGCKDICLSYSIFLLILLELICSSCAETEFNELPLCRNYQACASRLKKYPILDDTIGELIEEIGSGHGSGQDHIEVQMQYDEFVTSKTPFDFNADPELVQKRLCRCADESEEEQKCGFDEAENVMQIDSTVSLGFCQPIQNTIRLKCIGRRNMVRIIGKIHETGEALTSIDDTAAFCSCPGDYKRARIEPWLNEYVFSYRCA